MIVIHAIWVLGMVGLLIAAGRKYLSSGELLLAVGVGALVIAISIQLIR